MSSPGGINPGSISTCPFATCTRGAPIAASSAIRWSITRIRVVVIAERIRSLPPVPSAILVPSANSVIVGAIIEPILRPGSRSWIAAMPPAWMAEFRSSSPSMLFNWIPLTTIPEPDPFEMESAAMPPSLSMTET